MLDFSNIIEVLLGVDDVLKIEDSNNVILWQKVIYYNVSISAGNNGSVSVNGVPGDYSQSVPAGTVLTIEGTGATGYDFDEWSDSNTDNPRTITVNSDLTLTASFAQVVTANYFYVEDISGNANTLSIRKDGNAAPTIEVFKSTDGTNWTSMGNTSTTAITATVPANSKLYLKATTSQWQSSAKSNIITCSDYHNVGGNIMSLLVGDNYSGASLSYTNAFAYLFYHNVKLVGASNLELPGNVKNNCYICMFNGCTSLTAAPVLPATTLANDCYYSMFANCTSLTIAPALPATTLNQACYAAMFAGCTSLTAAPVLPATTLANDCYYYMFYGCTSLTTAPALPVTTLAPYCYRAMFQNCTSLTTAPVLPATTLTIQCYDYMFSGCTSLTTAPALPATTLDTYCYNNMFSGCTSLTTAPTLPATTLTNGCYKEMFSGCTLIDRIDVYADDNSATDCTSNWLYNVAASGDFYNYSGTATYTIDDPSGVPVGWTLHNMAAQPNDEIWYETNNGQIADFSNAGFNATILSNTYTNGKGVVKFNSNVTSSSGNNSTSRATNLTKIWFPDSFTSVGQHTFDGCPLTELDLNKITTIGYEAFDFNHIQHLHIPATCTNFLRGNPFRSTYITQITVDPGNPTFTDGSAHNGGNCVYNGTTIAVACKNTVIPDNCTSFGEWSFSCIPALTTLDIPSTVTSLQGWAVDFDTTMVSNPSLSAVYARTTPTFGNNVFDRQKTGGTLYYTSGVNYSRWLNNLPNYWTAVLLCDVTISAGSNGSISVDGVSGNYHQPEIPSGTQLTLVATPAAGYQFDSWSDGNTNATRTLTVTGNTTLTASFILPNYNVSISAGNNGSISVNGVSGNYTASVPSGTQLTLVATPAAGYQFDSWSDGDTNATRTITVTADTTLTASFVITPQNTYFYVENPNNNDITMQFKRNHNYNDPYDNDPSDNPKFNVYTSTNQTSWSILTNNISAAGNNFTVPANSRVYIKATTDVYAGWDGDCQRNIYTVLNSVNNYSVPSTAFNVGGNIMSLLFGDNFRTATWYNNTNAFKYFFYQSKVRDASNLWLADANNSTHHGVFEAMFTESLLVTPPTQLPATTLGEYSYKYMFIRCTHLATAPVLPATTLSLSCYYGMFIDCTSLTTAPTLPATTLAEECYQNMFKGCTSLTTAPSLPATTLAGYCYNSMFYGCTSLNSVTTYANTKATYSTTDWLNGVAAQGDFFNFGSATYTTGVNGIPSGWTVHTTL